MAKEGSKPTKQRALVLQGGGTLEAYEAGVLEVLCKKPSEEDKENKLKNGLCNCRLEWCGIHIVDKEIVPNISYIISNLICFPYRRQRDCSKQGNKEKCFYYYMKLCSLPTL